MDRRRHGSPWPSAGGRAVVVRGARSWQPLGWIRAGEGEEWAWSCRRRETGPERAAGWSWASTGHPVAAPRWCGPWPPPPGRARRCASSRRSRWRSTGATRCWSTPATSRTVRADTEARARALVDEVRWRGARRGAGEGAGARSVARAWPAAAARELVLAAERRRPARRRQPGPGRGAQHGARLGGPALRHPRPLPGRGRAAPDGGRADAAAAWSSGSTARRRPEHALERALVEAGRLGAEVTAVAAYSPESYWSDAYEVIVPPVEQLQEDAQRGAEEEVTQRPGGGGCRRASGRRAGRRGRGR